MLRDIFFAAIVAVIVLFINWVVMGNESRANYSTNVTWYSAKDGKTFTVPEDNQLMRVKIRGMMPYSSWKSVEIEIFDENDNYLFNFHDELWSEKGRTGGESWKESRTKAYADIWFPSAGTYKAYLSDTYSTRIAENTGYRPRHP